MRRVEVLHAILSGDNNTSKLERNSYKMGFPLWFSSKESTCNAGDTVLIPGSGRSPGEVNDNPLQYSCLGNPMDREAWQAVVHGVKDYKLDMAYKLQDYSFETCLL